MNNLSTPAMPLSGDAYQDFAGYDGTKKTSYNPECQGFTKLEQACITLGIPESGDPELDALILKSERKRIAAMAMQGILQGKQTDNRSFAEIARLSVSHAKSVLKELDQ